MPIFEYYCSNCKVLFEELVRTPDIEKATCPRCDQKEHTQKCISTITIGKGSNDRISTAPGACSQSPYS